MSHLTHTMTAATCPTCGQALDGGPVLYYCASCRRAVWAADLDLEYRTPGRVA